MLFDDINLVCLAPEGSYQRCTEQTDCSQLDDCVDGWCICSAGTSWNEDQERCVTDEIQEGGSYYKLTVVLPSGLSQEFEKQLDDKSSAIAFGSSHIAPAVSLTVEDTFFKPFATVTLFFCFVVGSNDHAVTITEEGKWDWAKGEENAPPGFKIQMKDQGLPRLMVSWEDESEGSLLITKWGTSEGEIVQGKISGTIVDQNALANGKVETGTVDGEFRLILPAPGT